MQPTPDTTDATQRRRELEHAEAMKRQLEYLQSEEFADLVAKALKKSAKLKGKPAPVLETVCIPKHELLRLRSAEVQLVMLEALMREHPEFTADQMLQIHEGQEAGPEWWDRTGLVPEELCPTGKHPKWQSPMSINTSGVGTLVEYMGENGRDTDREQIERAGIQKLDQLTVRRIHFENWFSRVEFEEYPGQFFNTVCFCKVD